MLGVCGQCGLRTTALDPPICDQALSLQPHPGHLFTLPSSCVYWALVPPPLHQRSILRPPPFSSHCLGAPGEVFFVKYQLLPSLPFRKLNLKASANTGKTHSRESRRSSSSVQSSPIQVEDLSLPQKNSAQGVALWLLYCRGGNRGWESIFGPTEASSSGEKAAPDVPGVSSFSFAFPCFSLGSSPFFIPLHWGSDPVNGLRFGTSEMSFLSSCLNVSLPGFRILDWVYIHSNPEHTRSCQKSRLEVIFLYT